MAISTVETLKVRSQNMHLGVQPLGIVMVLSFDYLTPEGDQAQALSLLMAQCFLAKSELCDLYLDRIGRDRFRAIYNQTQLVGGLALIPMGQWWHGKHVPMTGIAAVSIAPEYRGSGAATALLHHMLRELYAEHVPLSVLYPATQRLYRKAGYEQGGASCRWEVPLGQIQMTERSLPLHPLAPSIESLAPIYQQKAGLYNGHLDRAPAIWTEILEPDQATLLAYGVGSPEQMEGYILFTQNSEPAGAILHIRDWVALTPAAGRSLWSFAANHRAQVQKVRFQGAAADPLLFLLPEQVGQVAHSMDWMVRLVHVPSALEKRGYPQGLGMELHLAVQDEILPENQGNWTLAIIQGQGTVTAGGTGSLKVDIRGLSALYAGRFTPHDLWRAGLLEGDEASIAIATQIFTTSPAWMPDFF